MKDIKDSAGYVVLGSLNMGDCPVLGQAQKGRREGSVVESIQFDPQQNLLNEVCQALFWRQSDLMNNPALTRPGGPFLGASEEEVWFY